MEDLTDSQLVGKVRENNEQLMTLLSYPAPTADGALLGYERDVRTLEVDGDELLEEADRRGLDRRAALLGVIREVDWEGKARCQPREEDRDGSV